MLTWATKLVIKAAVNRLLNLQLLSSALLLLLLLRSVAVGF